MARPRYGQNRSFDKKSGNPLQNWLSERKERRKRLEEEAAKQITDDIVNNENRLIDTLAGIDFLHSKLPKSILEHKSREDDKYCELEKANRALIRMLTRNSQPISMDVRSLDERLYKLASLFKQAVDQGQPSAAYAAKSALYTGLNKIRLNVPSGQPELAGKFVEIYSKYLDEWITLVELSQEADSLQESRDTQQAELDRSSEEYQSQIDALEKRLFSDAETVAILQHLTKFDSPAQRSQWTDREREIHRDMVDHKMKGVQRSVNNLLLQSKEFNLQAVRSQIDILHAKIAAVPVVTDENLMNKYQESVDALFHDLAKSDAEIEETLRTLDEIDGRLQQLDESAGSQRLREVACESAVKMQEEIQEHQKAEIASSGSKIKEMLEEMGIHSQEEMDVLKRQREEQENLELQTAYEQYEERELLYN